MLTTLRIKNLALVEDLTVELQSGYNVITGETGAGKSILIGALNLVLGERAERTLIRSGSESCTVEAVFDISRLKAPLGSFLEETGLEACEDHQLVLKRSFGVSGTNRQFINGSATTLNILFRLGQWLVDIHGPHEHQSLLRPAQQLEMVDAFGGLLEERDALADLLRQRSTLESERSALIGDEATYAQQLDLLRFQVNEISMAKLLPGEEEQVEAEYRRGSNAAKLLQLSRTALDLLSESDASVLSQAGIVGRTLQELRRIDSTADGIVALQEQAILALQALQAEISKYEGKVEVDPERLQQLEERLGLIQSLKRKYGRTVAEVIAFGDAAAEKLKRLESREAELEGVNKELQKLDAVIQQAAKLLSEKRRKASSPLSKSISKQLVDLGFKQSQFEIAIGHENGGDTNEHGGSPATAQIRSSRGNEAPTGSSRDQSLVTSAATALQEVPRRRRQDRVEFRFSPNPGEPLRPLRAIASSGELARVMLAIKTVLAAEDHVPVLVFDEVDANVGGETANAVGEKMRQIAKSRQVICITHLPQVAAPAQTHFVASKELKNGRTISEIKPLPKKDRVTELARMLGGQTDAARRHAEELLATKT